MNALSRFAVNFVIAAILIELAAIGVFCFSEQAIVSAGSIEGIVFLGTVATIGTALYFLPTLIAANRNHPNVLPIFVLNTTLGWTLWGYVAALAWSVCSVRQ
jgi:hypothetical protein